MSDNQFRKNGLVTYITIEKIKKVEQRDYMIFGPEVLAKTKDDFLFILNLTRTEFVDYTTVVCEFTSQIGIVNEFYPELN